MSKAGQTASKQSGRAIRTKQAPQAAGPGREFVQGIERGFAVVQSLGAERSSRTIAEVANLTGLTRAVARRYLFTLLKLGYVTQHESEFALAPRILDLGFAYLSTSRILKVAPPFMERLVARLHESCSIAVLDGPDVVYVAQVSAGRLMRANLAAGSRLPAHATSMGTVLLAHLSKAQLSQYLAAHPLRALTARTVTDMSTFKALLQDVRKRGWALSDGQLEEGVRSVAAPIVDGAGQVVAAINVGAHAARVSVPELKRVHVPVLLETAAEVSQALAQLA